MDLSIIIVNYNGLRFLKDCFESVISNAKGLSFEIVVLDNNSADESCKFIRQNYPEILLIESKENLGFGKGNNEAVKRASGEYLLLLNNDTIILDRLLSLVELLKKEKTVGVLGINMLDGNRNYLQAVGTFPNTLNMLKLKRLLTTDVHFADGKFSKKQYDVDWLGGSFLMLSSKLYQEIDGFDQDYFMYVEDVDFCKKIADKGYRRIFLSDFSYIHYIGFNNARTPLLIKGYEIYLSKHLHGFGKISAMTALKINKFVKRIKSTLGVSK